ANTTPYNDVHTLDLNGPYVPSNLVLTGNHAFPLAMNSQGQVLMAASIYGRGKIVVLAHEGYLATFPALVENAVTWLRGDGSNNSSVGVQKNLKTVADNLSKSGFQAKVVGTFSDSPEVGVYVTDAYRVGEDPKDLVAFLKAGGGVLIGGQAWHWASQHPKKNTILDFPGNKVSGVAGIYFVTDYGKIEILHIHPQIPSFWKALEVRKDFKDDLEFLLEGISEFDIRGDLVASEILVHGPLAFPIGTTEDGRPFLAGTYYGKGRVIVVSHEHLLQKKTLASFWNNALNWLDQDRKGVVGVVPRLNVFAMSGLQCEKTKFRKDLNVFVCTAYSDKYAEEIQDFVAEGGGLLIGGHAWYWAQTHGGENPLTEFSGNRILNKMGLSLLPATISEGSYKAPVPSQAVKDTLHFRSLLRRFAAHVIQGKQLTKREQKHLQKLGMECASFLKMKAHDTFNYTQVLSILTDILKKTGMPQVAKTRHSSMVSIVLFHAKPEEQKSTLSHCTAIVEVTKTFSALVITHFLFSQIQIGCQTDYLDAEELKRAPSVHASFPITAMKMQVGNLWGGLIYLVAPPDVKVEGAEIIVQKAVLAPYYKSGVTTAADWSSLRTAPSPWAELEFDNIVLTVPSDIVRDLERPDEVADLWNGIMKGVADLAVIPRKFTRKERIVADVQISVGWMHAGYPIMIQWPSASELVKPGDARTEGLWGETHELGHNQQRDCWEFRPHTTEATCNLWSVYVHEEVLGVNRAQAHPSMTPTSRRTTVEKYVKGGKNLSDWTVWVALETYLQLQEKFGWDAFKKVFAAYHEMSNFPSDKKGKMNLYAETFSQTVKDEPGWIL
uniref:Peptidase M60 domain-containing protein n=1 Tax=Lates calcarifer TaxID=8187 RepID=A0A4W6DRZ1_LATCA